MAFQGPWLNFIDGLAQQFQEHRAAQVGKDERNETEFFQILRDTCGVVRDAEKEASTELPEVVEKAGALLSNALNWAYKEGYYNYLECFTASPDSPEVKDGLKMCGMDITETFVDFYTNFLHPGAPRPRLPKFARTPAWTKSPRPHPFSTRLSRFRDGVTSPASDATPLAQLVYQARAQLTIDFVSSPYAMELSASGSILAMTGAGGWKQRDPKLLYYILDEQDDETLECVRMEPGLSNVARYIATDEDRKLVFLADYDRVKSYSWAPDKNGRVHKCLPNVHTMNSLRDFDGAIALLPNGRLFRAGTGQAAVWNLDALETHQSQPGKLIGEGKLNTDNSWREADCSEIETSSGSLPHSIVAFADLPTYAPTVLHVHSPSGRVLCGERGGASVRSYGCVAIDVEHGGRRVARYLGHGQDIERITTSPGDPNVFVTAGSDGFARIFDVRRPLPVLTFDAGNQSDACADVVYVHPDGIPTLFTGGERTEQVKVWDVRAKSVVYDLSTGNNAVVAMAWDPRHSSLFVATECRRMSKVGAMNKYRKARIPRWATWKAVEKEAKALKKSRGEPVEEDSDSESESDVPDVVTSAPALSSSASAGGQVNDRDARGTEAARGADADREVSQPGPRVEPASSSAVHEQDDTQMADAEDDRDEDDDEDEDDAEIDEGEDHDSAEAEESSEEEEPDDIDQKYSASKRWP